MTNDRPSEAPKGSVFVDIDEPARARWPVKHRAGLVTVPLLLLVPLALWGVAQIERRVKAAAPLILEEAGIDTETLAFEASYRNIAVTGSLPTGIDSADVKRALEQRSGPDNEQIRSATIQAELPGAAVLGQINVRVTVNGETIILSGTVPSELHRDILISSARGSGLAVVANITNSGLAPSANNPSGQVKALADLLTALAGGVSSAELALGDDGPVVGSVNALDAETADGIRALAGPDVLVDAPVELGETDIRVTFDGTRIVFTGNILSGDQRDHLIIVASSIVGRGRVVDNMNVLALPAAVPGTDDRIAALANAIATFDGLTSGDARLNDTDLTVNGEALDDAAHETTSAALATAAATGLRPGGDLRVAPPEPSLAEQQALLQAGLDTILGDPANETLFADESAELGATTRAMLQSVVQLLDLYPKPNVEIGGHTDSLGAQSYNLALSELRAMAVVDHLVGRGIDRGRLTAVGYGETNPRAENSSPDGRAQNRRVEIAVVESTEKEASEL